MAQLTSYGFTRGDSCFHGGVFRRSHVGQNPINYSDPLGLKPGDIFQSVELAATDAIMYATQLSNAQGVEFGGWITKTNDCKFTYNDPTRGTKRNIPGFPSKPGNSADAWYHTHLPVNWFDEHVAGANPREFSPADIQLSDSTHSTGYMGFGGNIYIYSPK